MIATWAPEERLAVARGWTPAERKLWRAERQLSVSEWNDTYRVLAGEGVLEPGPWRTSRTPYLREPMDCLGPDSGYEEVTLMCAARWGKTELGKCATSFWAKCGGGQPILLVFPDKDRAADEVRDHYEPMLRATPVLNDLFSDRKWDVKNNRINLLSCVIRTGYSRSATSLSGFQAKFEVWEERDCWGAPRGGANPSGLARARAMQYGPDKRILDSSTPTEPTGPIARSFAECSDRRYLHLPCQHCGELSQLKWENARWDDFNPDWKRLPRAQRLSLADELATGQRRVWIECEECSGPFYEAQKLEGLPRHVWVSEGYPPGERPVSNRVAFQGSALCSPWIRLSEVATQAVLHHLSNDWRNFVNLYLGLPYEMEARGITVNLIESCVDLAFEPLIVPDWTQALCSGIDTQQDRLVWVVRAFGPGDVVRGIDFGEAEDWDELDRMVIYRRFMIEGLARQIRVARAGIDIGAGGEEDTDQLQGNRTDEVYRWCAKHPQVVRAMKGRGGAYFPADVDPITPAKSGKGRLHNVETSVINPQHYRNRIAGLMHGGQWQEPHHVTREYKKQLSSHHLVLKNRTGRDYYWWQKRYKNIDDHFFDASVYCLAAADVHRVAALPTALAGSQRDKQKQKRQRRRRGRSPWVETDQWSTGHRGW